MKWVMEYMYETWGLVSGIVHKHFKSMIWYIAETYDSKLHLKYTWRKKNVVWPDSGPITE